MQTWKEATKTGAGNDANLIDESVDLHIDIGLGYLAKVDPDESSDEQAQPGRWFPLTRKSTRNDRDASSLGVQQFFFTVARILILRCHETANDGRILHAIRHTRRRRKRIEHGCGGQWLPLKEIEANPTVNVHPDRYVSRFENLVDFGHQFLVVPVVAEHHV